MQLRSSFAIVAVSLLALIVVGFFATSLSSRSVEFGLAELSPRGTAGGYATPASGASTPSTVTVSCKLDGTQARLTWSTSNDLYNHSHGITYNLEVDNLSNAFVGAGDYNLAGLTTRTWTGNITPGQAYTWRVKGCSGAPLTSSGGGRAVPLSFGGFLADVAYAGTGGEGYAAPPAPAGSGSGGSSVPACSNPVGSAFTCNALSECPSGYTLDSEGFCTSTGGVGLQCSTSYYCQGSDLYYRELVSNSCQNQFVQTCQYGCSGGSCLLAPAPQAILNASPILVQRGNTTIVHWEASNVSSCTVTGTNGDSWGGFSGTQTTSVINVQTTYTLRCTGLDGSALEVTRVVNILPVYQEV